MNHLHLKSNHHHHQIKLLQQENKKLTDWIYNPFQSNQSILPTHSIKFKSSNQTKKLKLIIIILMSILFFYKTIIWILDQPNHLQLDPIIDPITFQINPTGDSYQTSKSKSKTKSSVSIDLENQQRLSNYHLRILHAINQNITKASKELNNKIIPIYDPLEETNLDKLNSTLSNNLNNLKNQYLWYKSDQGLIKNLPISKFKCDKSLGKESSLIFIGIFTTPERYSKRNLIRTLLKTDLPTLSLSDQQTPLIDLVFISGKPKNEYWNYLIEEENKLFGNDLIILDQLEFDNIDLGKTFEFFKWISNRTNERWNKKYLNVNFDLKNQNSKLNEIGKPQFVMKSDDDTFLVIPNLIKEFQKLDCNKNIYWGTSQGSNPIFPPYFRGLAYALSWPLVEWIGTSNMSYESKIGIEDARVGAWLSEIDLKIENLNRIDVGWKMGDWNQLEINQNTIALHWIKSIEWFPMVKFKVLDAWKSAGMDYRWDWFYKLP